MPPSVPEGPTVRLECGNGTGLKHHVPMVFRKVPGVSQSREKGKLPMAPAEGKPDWV